MATIKETMDVLALMEASADFILNAMADGHITAGDLLKALPVLMALKDAVVGAQGIPAELKDLDGAEFEQLASRAIVVVTKLSKAVMAVLGQAA